MSILDTIIRKVKTTLGNNLDNKLKDAVNSAVNHKKYTYRFSKLPENLEEFKAMPGADLKDPNVTCALTICALCEFAEDREASVAMLNYLKGPRPMSQMDISFVSDRFMDGVDYIPRSYLNGTTVENDYTPSVPYSIDVWELNHSRDSIDQNYLRLFINSSGADSPRYVDLRLKPSTGEWFLWEFGGVLSGIRIPRSKNEWA
jgi:hypothetical protein